MVDMRSGTNKCNMDLYLVYWKRRTQPGRSVGRGTSGECSCLLLHFSMPLMAGSPRWQHRTPSRRRHQHSVLSSLLMYICPFRYRKGSSQKTWLLPIKIWAKWSTKRKYRLDKWDILCQPKDQGGLGIHNLDIKIKLLTTHGTWQKNKYYATNT